LKEKKIIIDKVTKAIQKGNLMASETFWEIKCPVEFNKQPDSKKCYFEGSKLLCKWDDLQMVAFPNTENHYACVCGNNVAITRKRRSKK